MEEYILFYNNFRLQRNLKGMTPNEVRYHANCNFIYF
ncbi:MAG: IS3 family transposase [Acholeplasmatales bacterium]|nr:IS3 family transposase [Acholeplasmatales bacterium]